MPHILDKLQQDHEKVRTLFRKLQETGDSAEKTRQQLCQQLKNELEAHTEFEEEVFYPTVRERGEGAGDLVSHAVEEHEEVKDMLAEIEDMEPLSEEFMAMVLQLQEAVEAHVREEEQEIFPLARQAIAEDEGEQMSKRHDSMVQDYMQAHQ